jgi:hypothetical protein
MADDTAQESTTTVETATVETTQQDDLGDAGKKALAQERAAKKAAEKQLTELTKRLQEMEDRDKTEAQKLADRAAAAEAELQTLRVESIRARVALTKGVPADLLEFLTASDEDSLSEQADRLLARLAPAAPGRPAGDVDQGARTSPLALNDPGLEGALKQKLGIR